MNLNIWSHWVSERESKTILPGLHRDQPPSRLINPRKGASLEGCRVEPVRHLGRWFVQSTWLGGNKNQQHRKGESNIIQTCKLCQIIKKCFLCKGPSRSILFCQIFKVVSDIDGRIQCFSTVVAKVEDLSKPASKLSNTSEKELKMKMKAPIFC